MYIIINKKKKKKKKRETKKKKIYKTKADNAVMGRGGGCRVLGNGCIIFGENFTKRSCRL